MFYILNFWIKAETKNQRSMDIKKGVQEIRTPYLHKNNSFKKGNYFARTEIIFLAQVKCLPLKAFNKNFFYLNII